MLKITKDRIGKYLRFSSCPITLVYDGQIICRQLILSPCCSNFYIQQILQTPCVCISAFSVPLRPEAIRVMRLLHTFSEPCHQCSAQNFSCQMCLVWESNRCHLCSKQSILPLDHHNYDSGSSEKKQTISSELAL